MVEPAPLSRRTRERLADLPCQAIYGLLPLLPAHGPRSHAALKPAEDGRVIAEAGGGSVVACVELEGQLSRPLCLPRAALMTLARRHPKGDRLVVDGPSPNGPPLLRLAALDEHSSATVLTPEAEPCSGTVRDLLADPPLLRLSDDRAALLNPVLIAQAMAAIKQLAPGPALLSLAAHDLLGLIVRGQPVDDGPILSACVAVARMLPVDR